MKKPVCFAGVLMVMSACLLSPTFEDAIALGIHTVGGLRECNSSDHSIVFCVKLDPQSAARCGNYDAATSSQAADEYHDVENACTASGCENVTNAAVWKDLNCSNPS